MSWTQPDDGPKLLAKIGEGGVEYVAIGSQLLGKAHHARVGIKFRGAVGRSERTSRFSGLQLIHLLRLAQETWISDQRSFLDLDERYATL